MPLICIKQVVSSERQTGHPESPFPSIGLALPVLSPRAQGAGGVGVRLWGPCRPGHGAGGRWRPRSAQGSPLQFYHSVRGGLFVAEQNLSWRWVHGPVLSTPGLVGSLGMPGQACAHRGRGFQRCRALSCPSSCNRVHGCPGPGLRYTGRRHPDGSRVLDFNLGAGGRPQKSYWLRTSLTVHASFFLFIGRYQSPVNREAGSCQTAGPVNQQLHVM